MLKFSGRASVTSKLAGARGRNKRKQQKALRSCQAFRLPVLGVAWFY